MDGMDDAGMSKADAAEGRLYGLMELAEGHQTAVQVALEGLAAERVALRQERNALAHQVRDLQTAMQATVQRAVASSMAGVAADGAAAMQTAAKPLLDRVAGAAESAGQAEAALRRVVSWASWRLLGRGTVVVGVLALLLWGAHWSVWWWASRDITVLETQKALLGTEIAGLQTRLTELEASRAALEKAGALAKIAQCPGNRPCIRVNEAAGRFEGNGHNDYRIIQGY